MALIHYIGDVRNNIQCGLYFSYTLMNMFGDNFLELY